MEVNLVDDRVLLHNQQVLLVDICLHLLNNTRRLKILKTSKSDLKNDKSRERKWSDSASARLALRLELLDLALQHRFLFGMNSLQIINFRLERALFKIEEVSSS